MRENYPLFSKRQSIATSLPSESWEVVMRIENRISFPKPGSYLGFPDTALCLSRETGSMFSSSEHLSVKTSHTKKNKKKEGNLACRPKPLLLHQGNLAAPVGQKPCLVKPLVCRVMSQRLYGLRRRMLIRSSTPGEVVIVTVPFACTRTMGNGPVARGSSLSGR